MLEPLRLARRFLPLLVPLFLLGCSETTSAVGGDRGAPGDGWRPDRALFEAGARDDAPPLGDGRRRDRAPPEAALPSDTSVPTGSVVVMAAGDIQSGSWSTSANFEKTAQILDSITFDFALGLGDLSNSAGTAANYAQFDKAWGRHKAKLFAVPGSHDGYGSGGSDTGGGPFYDYFNGTGSMSGVPAPGCHSGPRGKGYFSMTLGAWLLIGLNYCATSSHTFTANDDQLQWLDGVMKAKPAAQPVIVIEHTPRYTKASGHSEDGAKVSLAWDILLKYKPDVKLFLCGHMNGIYERWVPMDNARKAASDGIRSFTVGTGGTSPYSPGSPDSLMEKTAQVYGVLQLTLRPKGYDWDYKPIAGASFSDKGTVNF